MLLVYASRTNNIDRFVEKLKIINTKKIETGEEIVQQNFILITYTDMFGEIPKEIKIFLKNNQKFLKAVAGSGNKNFGNNFCGAAKKISEIFKVELISCFELSGNENDIKQLKNKFLLSGGY